MPVLNVKEHFTVFLRKYNSLNYLVKKSLINNKVKEEYEYVTLSGIICTLDTTRSLIKKVIYDQLKLNIEEEEIKYIRTNYHQSPEEFNLIHVYELKINGTPIGWESISEEKLNYLISNNYVSYFLEQVKCPLQKETEKIILEGCVGGGKTYLITKLKEYYEYNKKSVYVIPEQAMSSIVHPYLETYYYYLKLWNRSFKILFRQKLRQSAINLQRKIYEEYQKVYLNYMKLEVKPDILLMDRSTQSTLIFMDLMIEENIITTNDKEEITKNYHNTVSFMMSNCKVIFWKPSLKKIIERINIRNRKMEKNLNDYIFKLNYMYLENLPYYYESYKRITLNAENDFDNIPLNIIKEIENYDLYEKKRW
jgi:deoxyadenosine/deoxycytidine kinase